MSDPSRKALKRRSRKRGMAPGSAVHIGEIKTENTRIGVTDYDSTELHEETLTLLDPSIAQIPTGKVRWVNVVGLSDASLISTLCGHFGVHPLIQEDLLNTTQRPKFNDLGDYLYIDLNSHHLDPQSQSLVRDQVGIVIGRGFLLSFSEGPEDSFDAVRGRLRSGSGRLRKGGSDYLAHALLDVIIDDYFFVLEQEGDKFEELEDALLEARSSDIIPRLQSLKRQVLSIHRSSWPLREAIAQLSRSESELISEVLSLYLRDLYEHTIQAIDITETLRDSISGLQDLYLSTVSARLNEVMKVLTIISTIFMPLSFVAGLYGMNFKYMPELDWRWSYPAVILVMAAMAGGMLIYFRRKRWLG